MTVIDFTMSQSTLISYFNMVLLKYDKKNIYDKIKNLRNE